MSLTSLIASRFLRSKQNDGFASFITVIAVLGIMLGTAALIVALAVLGGFEEEISDKVIGFTSHVQIQGFQNQVLRNPEKTLATLTEKIPVIRSVGPYVAREALIRSANGIDGVLLKGVDPERDLMRTRRYLVEGTYDLIHSEGELPKLVIGKKLARKLILEVGDKAAIFGLSGPISQGQLRVMQFQVAGIYESGMSEYDDVVAFTGLGNTQRLFQMEGGVSGYDILLADVDSAAAVAEKIGDLLGYPHYARTVFQSYRNIFSWIELQKRPVPIILGLIIIVATVNIIGTLLMIVLSKTREIGALMAMGMRRRTVGFIFLRQGLSIALVGAAAGNILAFLLTYLQEDMKILSLPSEIYFMNAVPVLLRWEYFFIVSALTIVLSVLCAVIPARLAAKMDPVKTLRFS
jgi:lipoprotein-releasing system permease protein